MIEVLSHKRAHFDAHDIDVLINPSKFKNHVAKNAPKNDFRIHHCVYQVETYKFFSWQMVLVVSTLYNYFTADFICLRSALFEALLYFKILIRRF